MLAIKQGGKPGKGAGKPEMQPNTHTHARTHTDSLKGGGSTRDPAEEGVAKEPA